MEEVRIEITPMIADRICRSALREYAVKKGLDDTEGFQTKNICWHSKGTHPDKSYGGGVIFFGKRRKELV